jgi:hypothetical protein
MPLSCKQPHIMRVLFAFAHLQTPPEAHRAAPYKPKAALLYTGTNEDTARTLTEGMFSAPALTPSVLLDAQTYVTSLSADLQKLEQQQGAGTVAPGELLSLMGLQRLGTSSHMKAGLYLETALVGVSAVLQERFAGAAVDGLRKYGASHWRGVSMAGQGLQRRACRKQLIQGSSLCSASDGMLLALYGLQETAQQRLV